MTLSEKKFQSISRLPVWSFTASGFVLGMLFSLGAIAGDAWLMDLDFSWSSIHQLHLDHPLLLITDVAPFLCAWFARQIGLSQQALQRKNLELATSRAHIQTILETAADGILTFDDDGTVSSINSAVSEIFGYAKDEIVGKSIHLLLPATQQNDSGEFLVRYVAAFEPANVPARREFIGVRKDGSTFPIELSVSNILENDGRIFTCIVRDITDRKQAERELHEKDKHYRQLVDHLVEGLVIIKFDQQFTFANPAAGQIFGLDSQTLMTQSIQDFFAAEEVESFADRMMACREGAPKSLECFMTRADGERRYISAVLTPERDAHNEIVGVMAMIKDTTEEYRASKMQWAAYQLAEITQTASDMQEFYAETHEVVAELMPARNLYIAWINSETGLLEFPYFVDAYDQRPESRPADEGLTGYLIQKGTSLLLNRENREQMAHEMGVECHGTRATDWLGVPLREGDVVQGALVVQSYDDKTCYSQNECDLLVYVGQHLSNAIAHKKATEALKESEERYALVSRGANDGLIDWDLKRRTLYISPRWKEMLGYLDHEIPNRISSCIRLIHPEDYPRVKAEISAHWKGATPHFQSEIRMKHADGTYRWMLCRGIAIRDDSMRVTRMAGSQTDITERRVAEDQLLFDAFHDALTGLPNRNLFTDRLEHSLSRSKRHDDYTFAVLFLDLDRFKILNDSMGHMVGDQMLEIVGRRLARCIRPGDTVARFGGDEFSILLDGVSHETDVTAVAKRIQEEISSPVLLKGRELITSASIGIAVSSSQYQTPEELLRDADIALYRAKATGKDRYEMFDKAMHARAVALLELENDLRRAIDRSEFLLHYQPFVSLETGRLTGFEALLRWNHPERGIISPERFISLAEETGLIHRIGTWALEAACAQLKEWQDRFVVPKRAKPTPERPYEKLSMNVNLSVKQFLRTDLDRQILDTVTEKGLKPSSVKLEITESVLMENPETTLPMIKRLVDRGFCFHLDDFGTGFSSLSYLHQFPIDTIKVDRSFIRNIERGGKNLELVRSVIMLARNLEIGITAEGVENFAQVDLLHGMQCQTIQGYYIAKPLPAVEAGKLIAQNRVWDVKASDVMI